MKMERMRGARKEKTHRLVTNCASFIYCECNSPKWTSIRIVYKYSIYSWCCRHRERCWLLLLFSFQLCLPLQFRPCLRYMLEQRALLKCLFNVRERNRITVCVYHVSIKLQNLFLAQLMYFCVLCCCCRHWCRQKSHLMCLLTSFFLALSRRFEIVNF